MVSVARRATGPDRGWPGGLPDTRDLSSRHESSSVIQGFTACPECGLPAEITDGFSLSSTDGPVEHVALACIDGHHFRMPADMLSPAAEPLPAGSDVPAQAWRATSASSSRVGFSRLPGTLGTVADAASGTQHF
jgi:hypothetical protein